MSLQEIDAVKAAGNSVAEVADSEWTTDAGGQVMVSAAAYQQAQAIATGFQFAAAQRALEANKISAYGQQTSRIGQMIPLLGQTQNYGLLANVTAGDPRAPYLSVPAGLARLGGPSPVQPDYASLKTYQAKDVSDFAKQASGEEQTSAEAQKAGSTKPQTGTGETLGAGQTQAQTQAKATAAAAKAMPQAASSTPTTVGGMTYGNTPTGGSLVTNRVLPGDPVPAASASPTASPAVVAATYTPNYARVSGEAGRHPGQSEWEARRDSWLGGQSHDAFQMAHSTTAQELNDVIKAKNRAAFEALRARGAWTPETSHGSNWRAAGDGGQNPYRDNGGNKVSFDYNGPAQQNYHTPHDRTLNETPEQRHKREQKEARDRAIGGTDTMQKPSMFGGGAGGGPPMSPADGGMGDMGGLPPAAGAPSDASGLPFDPHNPNPSPQNLQEIAAILSAPPAPMPSPLEAAVRECWVLGPDGQPVYTGHYGQNAAMGTERTPGGLPGPAGAGLGDAETPADVGMEGGSEPTPGLDMGGVPPPPPSGMGAGGGGGTPPSPMPGGKPPLFARGGTMRLAVGGTPPVRDDYRTNPGAPGGFMNDPRWGVVPVPGAHPTVTSAGGLGGGQPLSTTSAGTGSATPARASGGATGGRTRQRSAPAGGGGVPSAAAAPSPDEMRKVKAYYLAQFGGDDAAATADLNSGSPEASAWLQSALGMARSGQLDAYGAPVQAQSAAPAAPVPARPTVADRNPGVNAALPRNPDWQRRYQMQQAQGAQNNYATAHPQSAAAPNPGAGKGVVNHIAEATASMTREEAYSYVKTLLDRMMGANNPSVGGLPAVYDMPAAYYHQHPQDAAHAAAGGTYPAVTQPTTFVARRPTMFGAGGQPFLVGEGTLNGHPGADELVSVVPSPTGTVVHVDPLQRRNTGVPAAVAATANLAVPGSPYHAKVGLPASTVAPGRMASGGTYGVVSPYGTVVRPGSTPSKTGQVRVPGGNGGMKTVPWYSAQPFPQPEYTLSRDVANLTPDEQQQVGMLTQQRTGMPFSQWSALQQKAARGILGPAPVGGFRSTF